MTTQEHPIAIAGEEFIKMLVETGSNMVDFQIDESETISELIKGGFKRIDSLTDREKIIFKIMTFYQVKEIMNVYAITRSLLIQRVESRLNTEKKLEDVFKISICSEYVYGISPQKIAEQQSIIEFEHAGFTETVANSIPEIFWS